MIDRSDMLELTRRMTDPRPHAADPPRGEDRRLDHPRRAAGRNDAGGAYGNVFGKRRLRGAFISFSVDKLK